MHAADIVLPTQGVNSSVPYSSKKNNFPKFVEHEISNQKSIAPVKNISAPPSVGLVKEKNSQSEIIAIRIIKYSINLFSNLVQPVDPKQNYSTERLDFLFSNGTIDTPILTIGGCNWRLLIIPSLKGDKGTISISLQLVNWIDNETPKFPILVGGVISIFPLSSPR